MLEEFALLQKKEGEEEAANQMHNQRFLEDVGAAMESVLRPGFSLK